MVHAFTCAGVLPSQYARMAQFSQLGCVGNAFVRRGKNYSIPSTFLHAHILCCLYFSSVPAEWIQEHCEQGCRSVNAGCCWRGKSSSILFYPRRGKCIASIGFHVSLALLYCDILVYNYCSGLSLMLAMTQLPMPIIQLYLAWLEGMRECGICCDVHLYHVFLH